MCGSGVTSSIALIERPEACKAVMALSRPEPGPLTLTSTSLTPYFVAMAPEPWAERYVRMALTLMMRDALTARAAGMARPAAKYGEAVP